MVISQKTFRHIFSLVLVGMILSLPACTSNAQNEPNNRSVWQNISAWGKEKLSSLYSIINNKSVSRKSDFTFEKSKITGDEYAVVIIGSGPAGLAAALTTGRYMLKTLIIDGPLPGGQLTETSVVENWLGEPRIGGQELINKFTEHADQYGIEHLGDTVTDVDFTQWPLVLTTEGGKKIRALSVVIATGAAPVKLNIPGEDDFYGRGVSTCAICDAGLYNKDKDEVVIIGGGDTASEMALQLAEHAKKITMLVRKDRMRASASIQQRVKAYPHVQVVYNVDVKKFEGVFKQTFNVVVASQEKVANSQAEADAITTAAQQAGHQVRLVKNESTSSTFKKIFKIITKVEKKVANSKAQEREIQQSARAAGQEVEFVGKESEVKLTGVNIVHSQTGKAETIPVQGAFLAIGHAPSTKLFVGKLPMHENGTIEVLGRTQATEIPGVFVAGEASDERYKQVILEAGLGNAAGLDVWRFLQDIGFNAQWLKKGSTLKSGSVQENAGNVVAIATLAEFEAEIVKSDMPVILDVWTENCTGCKKMEPAFMAAAQEAMGKVKFVKVNGGTARDILLAIKDRYGVFVRHMPYVLAFKGGQLISQFATVMSADDFKQLMLHLTA